MGSMHEPPDMDAAILEEEALLLPDTERELPEDHLKVFEVDRQKFASSTRLCYFRRLREGFDRVIPENERSNRKESRQSPSISVDQGKSFSRRNWTRRVLQAVARAGL